MLQRFKARWAQASLKEKIMIIGMLVVVAAAIMIHAEYTEQRQPLRKQAFMDGCLKSVTGVTPEAVKNYCECTADGMTPEMLASARQGTPHMTAEIAQLAQSCSRKIAEANE